MQMPNREDQMLASPEPAPTQDRWVPPTLEVICLACEISSYAPDGDFPLF